jgi:hypothetical protein
MAENSLSYFLGQYNIASTGSLALFYNYNTSGVVIPNTSGAASGAGVFYQNYNLPLSNWSSWDSSRATYYLNSGIAPDGTNTASYLKTITGTSPSRRSAVLSFNVPSGVTCTFSVYLKSLGERYADIWFDRTSLAEGAYWGAGDIVDLQNATTAAGTSYTSITSIGNGWNKCSLSATPTSNSTQIQIAIGAPNDDSYSTVSGSGILIWGAQIESGVTSNNFWQNSGSGLYSGTYSYTPTNGNLNLALGTYILLYNKIVPNSAALISTVYTGKDNSSTTYYGGYEFGVTANNYLYFEYYSKDGPQVFTSNIPLADQSAVFLSLQTNQVSFGNYDYYANQLNSNSYAIQSQYLFSPSGFYVGYNPGATGLYCHNKPFTGYIDELLYFKNTVFASTLPNIFSGFVCDYYPATVTNVYTPTIGVTGTESYVTGYFTKVTGYSAPYSGTGFDYFGNITYTGTAVTPLTGTVSGTNVVQLTGIVNIFSGQIFTPESLTLNTNFRSTFGKKTINLIYPVSTGDVIDINLPSSSYPSNYENNLQLIYNAKNNVFSNKYLSTSLGYIVFQNGMALNSGSYNITGGVYNSGNQIINDYYIDTKNNIYLANNFNPSIDKISMAYADTFTGIYNTGLYVQNFTLPCSSVTPLTNLLPYSNIFTTNWTLQNISLSGAQADPFGGTGAWKLIDNSTYGYHDFYTTISKGSNITPYTFSIYAKAAEYSAIALDMSDFNIGDAATVFNLTNGTTINSLTNYGGDWGNISGQITNAGNGWYRCALSATQLGLSPTVAPRVMLVPNTGAGASWSESYAGNGISGVYLYGAQLEVGMLPGPYLDNNTSSTRSCYVLPWDVNQNNIFYNGQKLLTGTNTQMRGSVASIGPTSFAYITGKNLLLYSQDFNNTAYWTAPNSQQIITPTLSDPLGGSNASKLSYTGTTAQSVTLNLTNVPINPNTNYTFSIYIQPYDLTASPYSVSGYIGASWGSNDGYGNYVNWFVNGTGIYSDFGNGNPTKFKNSVFKNISVGNNWYRQSFSFTSGPNSTGLYLTYALFGWVANITPSINGIPQMNFFGAQLELGSGATSYSRTSNTINTTQTNGVYFLSGSQPFSSSSGNLFALPRNFQTEVTGNSQTFYNLPTFYNNYSEVYKNGMRLNVEMDYLELAQYDINSGQGIFDSRVNLLYNNNDLF